MQDFKIEYKKLYKPFSNDIESPDIFGLVKNILKDEKRFIFVIAIYSFFISLFTIVVPVSVQLLINSVSFTALLQPVITLGMILLVLLIFSGCLYALQVYMSELFQRRFMAHMSAKVCLQFINADIKKLEQSNTTELTNRFFDVVTIQKNVPKFITKTFSFLLQAFIGLVLVSFYHPFFLIFSVILIFLLYLIYALYFKKACIAAFYESRRKYDIVGWIEDVAQNITLFKSEIGQKYAKFKTDELTKRYLIDKKAHFHNLFSQTILLLLLYAFANMILLILGGYLVLKGELTIGQLVAAELVLSAIFYGIAQFGKDLENIYGLIVACEKLSNFFNIPLKIEIKTSPKIHEFEKISLRNISSKDDKDVNINIDLYRQNRYLIHDKKQDTQKFLIDCLHDFCRPLFGEIKIDDQEFYSFDMPDFRNKISVINSTLVLEGTLIENLTLNRQDIKIGRVNDVLKDLGLEKTISKFTDKLNLRIIPSGWPLSQEEIILLKVARAILMDCKIIIINEIFDILNYNLRQRILKYITSNSDAMLIYFSNHSDDSIEMFDEILEI